MRRPRLALPFTVLAGAGSVRLVAGEDLRYALAGPALETWLPALLASCDGRRWLDDAIATVPEVHRESARALVDRLYGERVLVDGPVDGAHPAARHALAVEGDGALARRLRTDDAATPALRVFCQDRLDYEAALAFNRARLGRQDEPWIWTTTGPMARGYVSPVFLPDAGPCLECLVGHFRRISPAPDLYDALAGHARAGRSIEPVPFPPEGVEVLAQIVLRKRAMLAESEAPAALYRLHVVDASTLEISTHRVFVDAECPACGPVRP